MADNSGVAASSWDRYLANVVQEQMSHMGLALSKEAPAPAPSPLVPVSSRCKIGSLEVTPGLILAGMVGFCLAGGSMSRAVMLGGAAYAFCQTDLIKHS